VLLLGVVSLMDGEATGVPMSSGYSDTKSQRCRFTTQRSQHTEHLLPEAPKHYTTKAVGIKLKPTDASSNYTNAPMYYSVPSYYTEDLTC
jgi:hypothetical protein